MNEIALHCDLCNKTGTLHGPLERVLFLLQTTTSCPLGSPHESLPTASATAYVLKGETNGESKS